MDALEFFSHNSMMPRISSTDQLLMSNQDMTDTLKHPHPDVPFPITVDDINTALTTLAAIFKKRSTSPHYNK